jgi:prepilin-type N-terminal cleavage/methylation domain-containing protein
MAGEGLAVKRQRSPHGFTMIELMIVLTIISILVSVAIPIANSAILRAKEAVLQSNLHTLRTLIDQYTADKLKAPQTLDDLVSAGYLRSIPKDPITTPGTGRLSWRIRLSFLSKPKSASVTSRVVPVPILLPAHPTIPGSATLLHHTLQRAAGSSIELFGNSASQISQPACTGRIVHGFGHGQWILGESNSRVHENSIGS